MYSDASDPGFVTTGKKFPRGFQTTDARGVAAFTTIYPGWYEGRAVHVHFKIRTGQGALPASTFTSQLHFNDELTDRVHARPPYVAKGQRTLRNSGDGIYRSGGMSLTLDTAMEGEGYAAFDIGLQI